jgi:two-component system chemotaxis response regulator CheB
MSRNPKTRVLIVDDSPLLRTIIADAIAKTNDLEVVGQAADGQEGLEQFETLRPDVVTLDIQMPKRNGLETLQLMLERCPTPVLMCSSLTTFGAEITLTALEQGALDYVAKPETGRAGNEIFCEDLLRKIRLLAHANVPKILEVRKQRRHSRAPRNPASALTNILTAQTQLSECGGKLIAIGVSTGGPPALHTIFANLRAPLPPIVIVQHMPPHFTKSLAGRLDRLGPIRCKEAEAGDVLQPNHAYLAPGGLHLRVERGPTGPRLNVSFGEPVSGHRPSVDVLMTSAAKVFGGGCRGVIMTGMGRDGVEGCREIRAAGGYVIGQDEATSDIYGMNRVAFEAGYVDEQFALDEGAEALMALTTRNAKDSAAL